MGMLWPVSVGPQQISQTVSPKTQKIEWNNRKQQCNDKLCELGNEGQFSHCRREVALRVLVAEDDRVSRAILKLNLEKGLRGGGMYRRSSSVERAAEPEAPRMRFWIG